MKTLSDFQLSRLSSNSSEILDRKLEELLIDTTTTLSSEFNSEVDNLIPYTFRVLLSENGAKPKNAKCPPFYMQLDHTIAVLWHVFARKDKERGKNIGAGQLQWALYFLKGIKDPLEGTRQADIHVAIKALEDTLINCYADMATIVMKKSQVKYEPYDPTISLPSLLKLKNKIGSSASLGIIVKPRRSFQHIEDLNISSLSYSSLEVKPDISATLKELILFRKATQDKKRKLYPTKKESIIMTENKASTNGQVINAYEMFKKLREDQIKKLGVEIENLRQLEESASIRTYFKIILQYFQSFKLWNVVYQIAVITIRLMFDQFRMDDIFVD